MNRSSGWDALHWRPGTLPRFRLLLRRLRWLRRRRLGSWLHRRLLRGLRRHLGRCLRWRLSRRRRLSSRRWLLLHLPLPPLPWLRRHPSPRRPLHRVLKSAQQYVPSSVWFFKALHQQRQVPAAARPAPTPAASRAQQPPLLPRRSRTCDRARAASARSACQPLAVSDVPARTATVCSAAYVPLLGSI